VRTPFTSSWGLRTVAGTALSVAIAAGAVTACGGSGSSNPLSGMSADQITTTAFANLKAAKSVHVTGPSDDSGQVYDLDVTLGTTNCQGTYSSAAKGSFSILKVNGSTYFSANPTFWKLSGAGGASLTTLDGKYLKVGPNSATLKALGVLCTPGQLASPFSGAVSGMVERGYTTVNGQKALHITDSTDPDGIYVSVSSKPEVLRLDAGSNADLYFTSYNAPVNLTAPPANLTLDGKKYGF
jgi:hypothetical protein